MLTDANNLMMTGQSASRNTMYRQTIKSVYGPAMPANEEEPEVASREAVFIKEIKQLREWKGWTQTELAREMKGRGFPFHQQTIQRIEDGARAVRLDEAFAFAEIFDKSLLSLTKTPGEDQIFAVTSALRSVRVSFQHRSGLRDSTRLMYSLERMENVGELGPRFFAGVELLSRTLAEWDRISDLVRRESEEMHRAASMLLYGKDVADRPDWADPFEKQLRGLVDRHKVPKKLKDMSIEDLGLLYADQWRPPSGEHQEET